MTTESSTRRSDLRARWRAADLRPSRVLLHPLWLSALAVMVFNDHVLKGSGLLPGAITGKLSDVAGLFLAPALLAVLLRARSRAALLACHAAVGVVFSAIQLSTGFTAAWVAMMGSLGTPWQVWMDPTDLLTLPALLASWTLLTPMMAQPLGMRRRLTQGAELAVVGGAVLSCMATSPPEPPPEEPDTWEEPDQWDEPDNWDNWQPDPEPQLTWDPIQGDVFLHNATGIEMAVRLRQLHEDVALLDCTTLATNPGRLLQPDLFAPADTWLMPPQTNLPVLRAPGTEACNAVMVEGDALEPGVLFWFDGQPAWGALPGGGDSGWPGAVIITGTGTGSFRMQDQSMTLLYPLRDPASEETPEGCGQIDPGERFAWSEPPRRTDADFAIIAQEMGPDGCLGVDLQLTSDETAAPERWFVCLPSEDAWPFVVDDTVAFTRWTTTDGASVALSVDRTFSTLGETSLLTFMISDGQLAPNPLDTTFTVQPIVDCPDLVGACGEVERAAQLLVQRGADEIALRSGEQDTLVGSDDSSLQLFVGHVSRRAALRASCSSGLTQAADQLGLITIQRLPAP